MILHTPTEGRKHPQTRVKYTGVSTWECGIPDSSEIWSGDPRGPCPWQRCSEAPCQIKSLLADKCDYIYIYIFSPEGGLKLTQGSNSREGVAQFAGTSQKSRKGKKWQGRGRGYWMDGEEGKSRGYW